ncbi:MAG: WD40 repeat domain-containing protein [Cytophagaceae bacterium]|nr:MAG: WD40 repeat domain-containing protein [Cytophagaceae bacterium]
MPLEDIHKSPSSDGRFEATGTLLRTPDVQGIPNYHGSIEVRDLKTGHVVVSWDNPGGVTGLSLSPDATLLAVDSHALLAVWKWKSKQRVYAHTFDTGGQFNVESAFSPNGKQLAVAFGYLVVLDVASWKTRKFPQLVEPAFVDKATWSPSGRLLALSQHDLVSFSLVELQNGRVRFLGDSDSYSAPLFSSDSNWLVGTTENGTFLWNVKSRTRTLLGGNYEHSLFPVAFSNDARFVACRSEKESKRIGVWRVRDGKRLVALQIKTASLQTLFDQAQKVERSARRQSRF